MQKRKQISHMLTLQDRLNREVDAHWISSHHEWYRAIWVEAAELLEHYGWKWWKSTHLDDNQVRLEMVDIWHFAMSLYLEHANGLIEVATSALLTDLEQGELQYQDFRACVEEIALCALQHHDFHVPAFLGGMRLLRMSFDDLYGMYVGKNVLNCFRQRHGYADGTYVKRWNGKEDNEYLATILAELEVGRDNENEVGPVFESRIYERLKAAYSSHVPAT